MSAQIAALEAKGFYLETYSERERFFADWNMGVLEHRWHLNKWCPCALCGSTEIVVRVNDTAVCLACLSEFPLVPWHPTGAVRPKTTAFINHALNCTLHSSPPTQPLRAYGGDQRESSSRPSGTEK